MSAVCSSLEPGGPLGLPLLDLPPLSTVVPSGSVVAVQYRGYPKSKNSLSKKIEREKASEIIEMVTRRKWMSISPSMKAGVNTFF